MSQSSKSHNHASAVVSLSSDQEVGNCTPTRPRTCLRDQFSSVVADEKIFTLALTVCLTFSGRSATASHSLITRNKGYGV